MSLRKIYYQLPPAMRFVARRLYYMPVDMLDSLSGKRDELTPPKGMIYTGGGDFKKQGQSLLKQLIELGDLEPHHRVLDIGSGIGRIAIPLTQYLNKKGSYEGFDVVELGVNWCKDKVSSRFPNFNFQYIPIDNDLYRADGKSAANFNFPYADNSFDFVVLTSVFTHMLPAEVENYMREIQRVLKKDGQCFATFFVLNKETEAYEAKQNKFSFPYDYGHYKLMDEKVKSANVAFQENYIKKELVDKNQLQLKNIHYGFWSGRPETSVQNFQDILVFKKV